MDEVRLHHVFEHFTRATALRLLIEWYGWLVPGGKLFIETPDFERCVRRILSPFCTSAQRMRLIRHLYGSQEAPWAMHLDAWDLTKFKLVLKQLGFRELKFSRSKWQGTCNISVEAYKLPPFVSAQKQVEKARELLQLSLVDRSPSELRMLEVWTRDLSAGLLESQGRE